MADEIARLRTFERDWTKAQHLAVMRGKTITRAIEAARLGPAEDAIENMLAILRGQT